jgi:lysozyme
MRKVKSKSRWRFNVLILVSLGGLLYFLVPALLNRYGHMAGIKTMLKKGQDYYYGLPGEAVKWPKGHTVRGIDVSRYQTHVNWPEVRRDRIAFAFIKATEGFYLQDKLFDYHWQESCDIGLLRGAYHFYRPSQPALLQALNFIRVVSLETGDLPPVLDIEEIGTQSADELRAGISTWLKVVEKKYAAKPIIYTNYNFYERYLAGHFDEYPLWIAHYQVPRLRIAPSPNRKLKFWQHTDRGRVTGIKGRVDCNVFYGSTHDLKQLCLR